MKEVEQKADSRQSVWEIENNIPKREVLSGDIETEVAVIGAGMAGLLIAYFLERRGKKVVVLEADRIAGGQTKHTTAKITSQHGLFYADLIKKIGMQRAKQYAEAGENAINEYQRIMEEEQLDCGFERLPAYLYSREDRGRLEEEAKAAASLGIRAEMTDTMELPFSVEGAVRFEGQAQFQPLAFVHGIVEELTVYEDTRAESVKGHVILTNRGKVTAEHIVFAIHYPFINVPGFYFVRQHQERSYVLALSGTKNYHGMYYSADSDGLSIRNAGDFLLLGGGAHRTGHNVCGGMYDKLRVEAEKYFPEGKIAAGWSAQDCVSHDKVPFIGKYSIFRPYWYVATGFKKWGMTTSMIAARIISDQICGIKNPYEEVFSPQRVYIRASFCDFWKDVGISVRGLLRGSIHAKRRCSHMGCECTWNPDEQSWDCPCHGSRFNREGYLIDNPAQTPKRAGQ